MSVGTFTQFILYSRYDLYIELLCLLTCVQVIFSFTAARYAETSLLERKRNEVLNALKTRLRSNSGITKNWNTFAKNSGNEQVNKRAFFMPFAARFFWGKRNIIAPKDITTDYNPVMNHHGLWGKRSTGIESATKNHGVKYGKDSKVVKEKFVLNMS